jgi:fatty-acyl-CoA synthase
VVIVSGPNVFAGYRDPAQNEHLWIDCGDGRRWLDTGDLARRDERGYFWLTGRKKELIIRGGHNIDPAVIEQPLHRHPAVQLAAAVGRPDAHAGEIPVAYVQLKGDTTEAELLDFLRGEIGERAAVPRHIRVVAEMPLTAVGKIYKPALKKREVKDALETALREEGVPFRDLEIVDDGARGMTASCHASDRAREVLGRFPILFTLDAP